MASSGVHFKSKALAAQVVLLVLPLLVLSTIGFLSLKQDKALALHEATVRAQAIADDLLSAFPAELTPTEPQPGSWPCVFTLNNLGEIVSPPPITTPTSGQRSDESTLSTQQRNLLSLAQRLEIRADYTNAIDAWKRFLAENPPQDFAALATFSLGVALENGNQSPRALDVFKSVTAKYPNTVGESGLPLQPIAWFKSIDWTTPNPTPELLSNVAAFGSNVVSHPSFVSATLLTQALQKAPSTAIRDRIQYWLERWQKDELSREVAQSAIAKRRDTRSIWFWVAGPNDPASSLLSTNGTAAITNQWWDSTTVTSADFNWLVATDLAGKNIRPQRFCCQSQSQVERRLFDIVNMRRIPEYMGVSVSIAGTRLSGPYPGLLLWNEVGYFGRRGGGVKKEYSTAVSRKSLASAALIRDPGTDLLNVSIWLTSEGTLYRNQKGRTFWFAAILGVASLGAAIGLLVVWRGFSRQLQLNELKSNFVSSVSHELRAPIASVRLMAESLESGKLSEPEKKQEYYKYIGQECRRLSALIENVLDFARIEQGRKQYELEPSDVASLMRQTVSLMQPYAAERQVSLNLSLDDCAWDSIHPVIDGRAVQQALVNLIDNAIKHSPAGSQVSVGLQYLRSENHSPKETTPQVVGNQSVAHDVRSALHSLEIWVEDNGPGIPHDQHEKIFERFYRLGSELRRETPGVGIGLSIVKHIVDAHGGEIRIRSSPSQGSRFSIHLPLAADSTPKDLKS